MMPQIVLKKKNKSSIDLIYSTYLNVSEFIGMAIYAICGISVKITEAFEEDEQ